MIVAALNDKLTGRVTDSLDAPLELDLEMLAQHITAYKVGHRTKFLIFFLRHGGHYGPFRNDGFGF